MRLELGRIAGFWLILVVAGCGGPPPVIGPDQLLRGHTKEITSIAFSPDGSKLASRATNEVKVWDVARRQAERTFPSDGSDFGAIAFSPDGQTLAVNRPGVGAVAWDLTSGKERRVYAEKPSEPGFGGGSVGYGWGLSYSPDGRTLAGGGSHLGQDGFVTLWDVVSGDRSQGPAFLSPVTSVIYAPDGKTLAVGSMSGTIDLFDPDSVRPRLQIAAARAYLCPVVFSSDGKALATASEDRTVKVWETRTGADRGSFKGHMKGVFSIGFHPGGRLLASGDARGSIFLWDLKNRTPIARLEGHQGKILALSFHPEGRLMASGGEDRVIRLWDLSRTIQALGP